MPTAREWHCPDPGRFFRTPHRAVILDAARRKGLAVAEIAPELYAISSGVRQHLFLDYVPDTLSVVATKISASKHRTLALLQRAGVRTPRSRSFRKGKEPKAWAHAEALGLPVVVKPTLGSGGVGVTSNIASRDHFALAWKTACSLSPKDSEILVEEHVAGHDYRLFVVGNSLACAARRDPASVTGDGTATIRDLVARKAKARRQNPYVRSSRFVLTGDMVFRLSGLDLSPDSILPAGQRLQLHPVANIGAGGESTDVTDQVHPEFARIAVRACRAIPTMEYSGIDLIAQDISRPPDDQSWAVIETNSTPDIALHHFPSHGAGRDAAGALLDYLFA